MERARNEWLQGLIYVNSIQSKTRNDTSIFEPCIEKKVQISTSILVYLHDNVYLSLEITTEYQPQNRWMRNASKSLNVTVIEMCCNRLLAWQVGLMRMEVKWYNLFNDTVVLKHTFCIFTQRVSCIPSIDDSIHNMPNYIF